MKRLARLRQPFLILTIAVAVLAPSIPITDTFSLRPEIIMAGILFLWLLPTQGLKILKNPVFIWLGLLAGMVALSLAYSFLILGRSFILQDTFEVVKVGVYAVIFYAACAGSVDAEEFKKTNVWILWIFTASAATGIMQYFNILRINEFTTPLYVPTQPDRLITGRRVIGTVGNPNHYGMLMLLGVCLALAAFLWARSSRHRWLSAVSLMMCTTTMLLATSRTVLAIAALPILFIAIQFVVRLRKDKARLRTIGIIALGMSATIVLLLLLMPDAWFERMGELLRVFESASLSGSSSCNRPSLAWGRQKVWLISTSITSGCCFLCAMVLVG